MINLCQQHFNELLERWGSIEAIKRSYEDFRIVASDQCEQLDCIKRRAMAETLEDILEEINDHPLSRPTGSRGWFSEMKARIEAAEERRLIAEGWYKAVPFEKREKV